MTAALEKAGRTKAAHSLHLQPPSLARGIPQENSSQGLVGTMSLWATARLGCEGPTGQAGERLVRAWLFGMPQGHNLL